MSCVMWHQTSESRDISLIEMCRIKFISLFYKDVKLLNFNISTGAPNLRTCKTIPAEGEDVISWLEALWNFNLILESPHIRDRCFFRKGYFGPFWPFWCCPCLRRDQFHGDPTTNEVVPIRFPINVRSCVSFPLILYLIQTTSNNCIFYLQNWDVLAGSIPQ